MAGHLRAAILENRRRAAGYAIGTVLTAVLVGLSLRGSVEFEWTEVVGFSAGALCVWLTVEQRVSQWPIGNASDAFYVIVFLRAGLYADTGLQVVYIALGFAGWYWWLHGGAGRSRLTVARTGPLQALACAIVVVAGTVALMSILGRYTDSTVPFWDAVTTTLSLVAQYMLTRKLLENWYVWMTADVIYIGLYIYKDLYLTAALYAVFLTMCTAGLIQWRRSYRAGTRGETGDPAPAEDPAWAVA